MIYIDSLGVGFKCPRKIHLNTQCPPRNFENQLTLSTSDGGGRDYAQHITSCPPDSKSYLHLCYWAPITQYCKNELKYWSNCTYWLIKAVLYSFLPIWTYRECWVLQKKEDLLYTVAQNLSFLFSAYCLFLWSLKNVIFPLILGSCRVFFFRMKIWVINVMKIKPIFWKRIKVV